VLLVDFKQLATANVDIGKSVWAICGQSKEKGLSISAKSLFYLVEAASSELFF